MQSVLASSKIRLLRLKKHNPIAENSKECILTTSKARLQGFISQNEKNESLYILLHGWEGSAQSTYIQLLANALYSQKQASIFRLNFRDHGNTHHLNQGLFHSCRLEEVVEAIQIIVKDHPHKKVYLCGFSLGGNFSLRVAAKAGSYGIRLNKVFAISPPLAPKNSMKAIEASRLYSKYFLKKWLRSLNKKQKIFPLIFRNSDYKKIKSLEKLTENLIIKNTGYNTIVEYFQGYQISSKLIDKITVPCEIITAWDDPVIPFEDFSILDKKKNIKFITTKHGGHCGFINNWKMHSWIEHYIIDNS